MLVIWVYPSDKPGYFQAWEDGRLLCVSRQPFLDGARKLLARGCSPESDLVMRYADSPEIVLKAKLGVAAKLTVAEGVNSGPYLTAWKPSPYSAVTPPVEENEEAATTPADGP